jgi:hypothetical protein
MTGRMRRSILCGSLHSARGLSLPLLVVAATVAAVPAPVGAAWPAWHARPAPTMRKPPDQSWMQDVPETPGAHARGKVAVFVFKGDDVYEPIRAAVVRTLRRRGFNVTATLRPVESAAQFREMSIAVDLAVFIEGEVLGEGARQNAHIRVRSGLTGLPIASTTFAGPTPKIVGDVNRTLWNRVGPAVKRTCTTAARPRRRETEPLRIEAGTPEELASEGT